MKAFHIYCDERGYLFRKKLSALSAAWGAETREERARYKRMADIYNATGQMPAASAAAAAVESPEEGEVPEAASAAETPTRPTAAAVPTAFVSAGVPLTTIAAPQLPVAPFFTPSRVLFDCSGPSLPYPEVLISNPSSTLFTSYYIQGHPNLCSLTPRMGIIPPEDSASISVGLKQLVTKEMLESTPHFSEPLVVLFGLLDKTAAFQLKASDIARASNNGSVCFEIDFVFKSNVSGGEEVAAPARAALNVLQGEFVYACFFDVI
jgi:hypothetical protein